jgi:hypothetical protein
MSAIAKSSVSPLLASSAQHVSRSLSPQFIRTIDLSEMRQLSRVTKFLIIVAAPGEDGIAQLQIAEGDLPDLISAPIDVFDALKGAGWPTQTNHARNDVVVGDVKVNFSTMEADRAGEPLLFTTLEFKTLKYLVENPRRVISRDELLNEVWGYNNYPSTRTVDNQVAKLRKKIEQDPTRPIHLRTIYGAGYKFLP